MDAYTPRLLDLGLACMIGKGKRTDAVKQSVVKNGAVYLAAIGGAGALMAGSVQSCEIIAWPDLGCEAVRKLVVKRLPADGPAGHPRRRPVPERPRCLPRQPGAQRMSRKRTAKCLALCALALAVCVGIAAALVISKNRQRAAEAAAAASAAAASEAAAKAAEEEAARAASEAAEAARQEEERLAAEAAAAKRAEHDSVQYGDKLGRIWVEGTNVDCALYWGDSEGQFGRGAGCRAESDCVLPGENGTVFIGGHTGTYFSDLGSTQLGAIIHLETDWGDFTYKVTDMQVIQETDVDKVRWGAEEPSCILYTCYPFGILTHTPQRYAVYADPVSADEYGVVPAETTEK